MDVVTVAVKSVAKISPTIIQIRATKRPAFVLGTESPNLQKKAIQSGMLPVRSQVIGKFSKDGQLSCFLYTFSKVGSPVRPEVLKGW